jgi:hypothetical protein
MYYLYYHRPISSMFEIPPSFEKRVIKRRGLLRRIRLVIEHLGEFEFENALHDEKMTYVGVF